jgi:glutamate--cysteine ligase
MLTDVVSFDDLAAAFPFSATRTERIGIEVEVAVLDPDTGCSVPYEGAHGIRALLEAVLRLCGGEPIMDGTVLVGIQRPDGTKITIEQGGALEYSSPPGPDILTMMTTADAELRQLAQVAAGLGRALVPGGNYPFTGIDDVCWMPISRGDITRQHFVSVGPQSAWGPQVMALTLATQATLDYTTEEDLSRKLSMLVRVSPVVAALFVNSPLEAGQPTGLVSQRLKYYTRIDPARTGVLTPALREPFDLPGFIDWATELPMVYRKATSGYVPFGRSFRSALADGFDDGTRPSWSDWIAQLGQIWTQVRLRQTLELRVTDGPPYVAIGTVPAFWAGLAYHRPSIDAADELLSTHTPDAPKLLANIATHGLRAEISGVQVVELAGELLRLARQGLAARVRDGLERPGVLTLLDPLDEILDTGRTFADQCLHSWDTHLRRDPGRYVAAYRIPCDAS